MEIPSFVRLDGESILSHRSCVTSLRRLAASAFRTALAVKLPLPHHGAGERFKMMRQMGSYDRYTHPTCPQRLTSRRAMSSVRGDDMARDHGVEMQAVFIHLASPHDRV
jgi:hypothetical protein